MLLLAVVALAPGISIVAGLPGFPTPYRRQTAAQVAVLNAAGKPSCHRAHMCRKQG